jgi:hypothetical protein
MLRITVIDSDSEQKLVLEGRLASPCLSELESAWENVQSSGTARPCIVDLRNTTFIDESADPILLEMKQSGVRFIACGVANTHRLEQLGICCR